MSSIPDDDGGGWRAAIDRLNTRVTRIEIALFGVISQGMAILYKLFF